MAGQRGASDSWNVPPTREGLGGCSLESMVAHSSSPISVQHGGGCLGASPVSQQPSGGKIRTVTLLLPATSPYGLVMAADTRLSFEPEGTLDGYRKIIPWTDMKAAVGFAGAAMLVHSWTNWKLQWIMKK